MTAALTVPTDWDGITPAWLTSALSAHHPGAVVDTVTVDMRDDGTNRRARLAITYSTGAGPAGPSTVFAKAVDPDHKALIKLTSGLLHEPRLLRGDAHIGNTYLTPGGDVGFLDWQVARRGNFSLDLGYFLQGALTTDDRRANERELLAEYRDALALPAAELPSQDEIRLRYRASVAHGLTRGPADRFGHRRIVTPPRLTWSSGDRAAARRHAERGARVEVGQRHLYGGSLYG